MKDIAQQQALEKSEVLKVTALVYFQEALQNQEYEACPKLIGLAQQYGADKSEIDEIITGYLKGQKAGGYKGANRIKTRLYSLKEE